MTLPEIDHVWFLVEHAQTFFAGETPIQLPRQLATIPNLYVRSDFFLAFPVPSNYTCDS